MYKNSNFRLSKALGGLKTNHSWSTCSVRSFIDALIVAALAMIPVSALANDPPVLTGLDGTPTFIEGQLPVVLDDDVTVSDTELDSSGDYAGAKLVLNRNGGASGSDSFSFQTSGAAFTVSGNNLQSGGSTFATFTEMSGTLTINFTSSSAVATSALVQDVIQNVAYQNTNNAPPANVQLDWTFFDDNSGSDTGAVTVSVTNVNDEPTLTATGQDPVFVEGSSAPGVDLFSSPTVSTIESSDQLEALSLTVTNISDGSDEILALDNSSVPLVNGNVVTTATNGLSVSVSVIGNVATVSFVGAGLNEAELQTIVDGMGYQNTSDDPSVGSNRVVTITGLTDSGGTDNGGDDTASLAIASTVSLTAVNDPPSVGGVFGENPQVVINSGLNDLSALDGATVSNPDSSDYNGGFLQLVQDSGSINGNWGLDGVTASAGGDGTVLAGETITVGGQAVGVVGATDDGQGGNPFKINFSAGATNARIQTLIRALMYEAPSNLGSRTFTLTLNDADGTSNSGDEDASGTFSIEVIELPPNANPIVALSTVSSIPEDAVEQALFNSIEITDANSDDQLVTLTATNGSIGLADTAGLTLIDDDGSDGTLAFSGSLTPVNNALEALTFTPTSNTVGAASIQVSTTDGNGGTASDIQGFTIADSKPSIADKTLSVSSTASAGTLVGMVEITGDQTGVTVSLRDGNTGDAFSIDNSGSLTVKTASALSELVSFTLVIGVQDESVEGEDDDTAIVEVTVEHVLEPAMKSDDPPIPVPVNAWWAILVTASLTLLTVFRLVRNPDHFK